MAKDLNKVQLTGRLGADPELRYTPQGYAVTTFRVASNRSWRSSEGETQEETEWFRVVAWNKLAELCNQWLSKGARVYIEGRLQTRQWQDQNGQSRLLAEVIASDMILLDRRGQAEPASEHAFEPEPPAVEPQEELAVAEAPVPSRRATTRAARTTEKTGTARTTAQVRLPRGKGAPFKEEDLPF